MGNDLREQLLKAGLVNKHQTRQAESENRKRKKGKQATPDVAAKQAAEATLSAKQAKDRELNRKREQARLEKAARAQVRELAEQNRQNKPAADIAFNVLAGKKIRKIYVTEEQRRALIAGRLGVVVIEGRSHIVPDKAAERVMELHAATPVYLQRPDTESDAKKGEDDPYADYKIPDDLIW